MNEIIVLSKKAKKQIEEYRNHADYLIIDVTSKSNDPLGVKFSPFYPHEDIPVPFFKEVSATVEGIWQGLKLFEWDDTVNLSKTEIRNMKNIKRTVRKFGECLGHYGGEGVILGYVEARKQIYLPSYEWVLKNKLALEVEQLQKLYNKFNLVLLDYTTNGDVENVREPLSHASLIAKHLKNLSKKRSLESN